LKDAIVEPFFTYLIPDLLYRMQFRTIGGLGDEANILRDLQGMGGVPTSSIDLHHDEVGRQGVGDRLEKEIHHGGVRIGQHE